jgi:hypothetical protein
MHLSCFSSPSSTPYFGVKFLDDYGLWGLRNFEPSSRPLLQWKRCLCNACKCLINFSAIERLDQRGPETDLSRRESNLGMGSKHSRKEPTSQPINDYLELLNMSPRMPRHGSPRSACGTWAPWTTWTAVQCNPNSTCNADGLLPRRRLASPLIHCHTGKITSGSPL